MDNPAENQQPITPTPDLSVPGDAKPAGLGGLHAHNGQGSPMLVPNDALLGFPILTSAPSYPEIEGKPVLTSISGVYGWYARIGGSWRQLGFTSRYGDIYATASHTLTLTNAAQWYTIGVSNLINGISGGGVTNDQANYRILPVAGNYRVTLSASFSVDRTCKLEIAADQGGVQLPNAYAELDVQAANKLYTVSVTGLALLTSGGLVGKFMTDTAGAVVTFERINLNICSV